MSASRFIAGLIVIVVGILLLLGSTDVIDIDLGDIFIWIPSLFILLGVFLMVKNRFRQVGGPIFMIVVAAVIQIMVLDILDILRFWPVILIVVGLVILIKSFGARRRRESAAGGDTAHQDTPDSVTVFGSAQKVAPSDQDSVNFVSVMGSATERIISTEFKGGQATAVMGESKLDLRDSSVMENPAVLELSVVMGQMEIRVPREWNVRMDGVTTVMGESKDERMPSDSQTDQTDLEINGTVVMGSLKIED
jgi:predicted membrane protein